MIDFKNYTVNVMDIRETTKEGTESYLENKLGKLKAFFEIIFKGITDEEMSILEDKIIKCYEQKEITFDDNSLYQKNKKFKQSTDMPRLEDLYKILQKEKKLEKYKILLKPYISGSMKFLNNYTNVNLSNKIIVTDVYDIDKIKEERGNKKILYLDEVWRLVNTSEETADFVFKVFKTIRKYGGAATAITQDINDFFALKNGKFGMGIINNSSIKCMFQLEENDLNNLEKIINISENEKYKLQCLERGNCIMCAGKEHTLLKVEASRKEHEFITTDRKDL